MSINFICFSQTNADISKNNFYSEKIRLNIKGNEYKDTIITFRNYIEGSDEKRMICNDLIIDKNIENLIWKCEYLDGYLKTQNALNWFSIISYKTDNQNCTIVRYFICKRESMEAVEMQRFKVENVIRFGVERKEITGINISPGLFEEHTFISIDEFEKVLEITPKK